MFDLIQSRFSVRAFLLGVALFMVGSGIAQAVETGIRG